MKPLVIASQAAFGAGSEASVLMTSVPASTASFIVVFIACLLSCRCVERVSDVVVGR